MLEIKYDKVISERPPEGDVYILRFFSTGQEVLRLFIDGFDVYLRRLGGGFPQTGTMVIDFKKDAITEAK